LTVNDSFPRYVYSYLQPAIALCLIFYSAYVFAILLIHSCICISFARYSCCLFVMFMLVHKVHISVGFVYGLYSLKNSDFSSSVHFQKHRIGFLSMLALAKVPTMDEVCLSIAFVFL